MIVSIGQPSGGHDVDCAPEQASECLLEMEEVEQRAIGLELDKEVDVAGIGVVSPRNGTEYLLVVDGDLLPLT